MVCTSTQNHCLLRHTVSLLSLFWIDQCALLPLLTPSIFDELTNLTQSYLPRMQLLSPVCSPYPSTPSKSPTEQSRAFMAIKLNLKCQNCARCQPLMKGRQCGETVVRVECHKTDQTWLVTQDGLEPQSSIQQPVLPARRLL